MVTQPHMPSSISIGSAIFALFIPIMYRQTDTHTHTLTHTPDYSAMSVAKGHIYMLCIYDAAQ